MICASDFFLMEKRVALAELEKGKCCEDRDEEEYLAQPLRVGCEQVERFIRWRTQRERQREGVMELLQKRGLA